MEAPQPLIGDPPTPQLRQSIDEKKGGPVDWLKEVCGPPKGDGAGPKANSAVDWRGERENYIVAARAAARRINVVTLSLCVCLSVCVCVCVCV
jgi:hypothetical protein